MSKHIWKFWVREGCDDDFIRMNTYDWPNYFGRSQDYRGTAIGRNVADPRVYVTVDDWTSRSAFDTYVEANKKEWNDLCAEHAQLYESAEYVGFYDF